jgi:hypothetical protein
MELLTRSIVTKRLDRLNSPPALPPLHSLATGSIYRPGWRTDEEMTELRSAFRACSLSTLDIDGSLSAEFRKDECLDANLDIKQAGVRPVPLVDFQNRGRTIAVPLIRSWK